MSFQISPILLTATSLLHCHNQLLSSMNRHVPMKVYNNNYYSNACMSKTFPSLEKYRKSQGFAFFLLNNRATPTVVSLLCCLTEGRMGMADSWSLLLSK